MTMTTNEMVEAVKYHARRHYDEAGWDVVVECYSDAQIALVVSGVDDEASAIAMMGAKVGSFASVRSDIENS